MMRSKLSFTSLFFGLALAAAGGCGGDATTDCTKVQISGSAHDITVSCDGRFVPCTATGTNGQYTITCAQQMSGICYVSGVCMAKPGGEGVPVAWIGQQPVKQSMYSQAVMTPECCLGVMADFGTGK